MKKKKTSEKGFTLIELLVVIIIIVILASITLPGVMKAIEQSEVNRARAEMQHLATVMGQVYNDIGHYVRLEDLTKPATAAGNIRVWLSNCPDIDNDYMREVPALHDPPLSSTDADMATPLDDAKVLTGNLWNGPYLTYKEYEQNTGRPLDPWGRPYRLFWSRSASVKPAGASGTMIIISSGSNKLLESNYSNFDPNDRGDDVYFSFNWGIQ